MAINIEVNGTLYPTSSGLSAEPTHDEEYGKGGWRTVIDLTARNDIPDSYKSDGMLVFNRDDYVTWQWNQDSLAWQEYPTNITGTQLVNGTITEVEMDDDSISNRTMQDNSIGTVEIINLAVTLPKLGTDVTDSYWDRNTSDARYLPTFTTVPSSDSVSGVGNQMARDEDYLYVCISGSPVPLAGNWGRTALTTTFVT